MARAWLRVLVFSHAYTHEHVRQWAALTCSAECFVRVVATKACALLLSDLVPRVADLEGAVAVAR